MNRKLLFVVIVAVFFAGLPLHAQPSVADPFYAGHGRNEIGMGVSGVYEIDHRTWAPSLHLHYFRTVKPNSRWALGGEIGFLEGEEKHFEAGLGVRYEPAGHLFLTLLPGVTITDRARFSIHAEATYDVLHIGPLHLGPVLGYGWSKNHSHISVGLHMAIGF